MRKFSAPILIGLLLAGSGVCLPALADNWSGSLRSKVQTDNRYSKDGDYTGEVWGQFAYDNREQQLTGRLSTISRFSTDIYREKQDVYQAYLEKTLTSVPLTLRGGRFERSDSLGLYLLDGASANYRFNDMPLSVDVYGGRPVRIDHVRSVEGSMVVGAEGLLKLTPHWSFLERQAQINDLDWRMGLQMVQSDKVSHVFDQLAGNQDITNGNATDINTRSTYRLNSTARIAGHLLAPDKPMEVSLQGSYAAEKNKLENVFLDGWWDPWNRVRLRSYFEAYRPKQPYVTFRDRFYSAYALGEQRVWRGSAQYVQTDKLRYSAGVQYASRDQGYSGQGINAGFSYQWRPEVKLSGEFDYLELDTGDMANSVYMSVSHALNAKTRYGLNLAWRQEDKLLYGQNQARGIENEVQYMLDSSLVLGFKGSYIDNSAPRLRNEYLAALQLTYYFDRFQAKKP
jgi:hypothetical protein